MQETTKGVHGLRQTVQSSRERGYSLFNTQLLLGTRLASATERTGCKLIYFREGLVRDLVPAPDAPSVMLLKRMRDSMIM